MLGHLKAANLADALDFSSRLLAYNANRLGLRVVLQENNEGIY